MANKILEKGIVLAKHLSKYFTASEEDEQFMPKLGKGLELNEQGQIVITPMDSSPKTNQILDNGSASVIGEQYTIDYGNGLIEVNGLLYVPLDTVPRGQDDDAFPHEKNGFQIGCSRVPIDYVDVGKLYHKESKRDFKASDFGMSKILSVNAISGDVGGYRTETPWVVNKQIFSGEISLGVHTLAALAQDQVPLMFQIKGLKA